MTTYSYNDHTFTVCAYKESPYLEACLDSLKNQTVLTNIIMATSTPNDYIKKLAQSFDVPLFVNEAQPGIASDWNFAMRGSHTPLVTIAHQDDTYDCRYAERMLEAMNSVETPLLYFTNYGELRDDSFIDDSSLLGIKRLMLSPFKVHAFRDSRFIRRRILSLGSAICCPSVTMAVDNLPTPLFTEDLKCDLDWQAWERVSKLSGSFLYDVEILMHHRIHVDSETTALIEDETRTKEDIYMLEQFWPRPIAHMIGKLYSTSQRSNG